MNIPQNTLGIRNIQPSGQSNGLTNGQVNGQAKPASAQQESPAELTHITEEIYKKNAQLAEVNRLLTLLRSIDEIVLSSVTDIKQNAQQVTRLVVGATGVVAIGILLMDEDKLNLKSVAFSVLGEAAFEKMPLEQLFETISVSLADENNLMAKALRDRTMKITTQLHDILPSNVFDGLLQHPEASSIKTSVVHPLIVHNETIGVMVVMHNELPDEISAFKRDLNIRLAGVIGIALDNGLLYHGIQEANVRLKELDRLKDDFVSVASHELRTPMTAIRSYLWMALKGRGGELNEKQSYYLNRAYKSTVRLINLVNDMLNISRIESGRIAVNIQKTDLIELVESVIGEVKPRADELGLHLTVKKRALPPVLADSDKIKEVLINLIGNSLKFTPHGGSIEVSFDVSESAVVTRVTDNGAGISAEDQKHLFQKFGFIGTSYKVNKSDSQGTGLGLYISKSIIDLHKGKMTVFSDGQSKGSTFTFSLKTYNDADFAEFQHEFSDQKEGLGVIHIDI